MNAKILAAAAAITVLSASASADEVPPQTTAERLADMEEQHDRLADAISEWPAGPEREKAEQELELIDTALEAIKADIRSDPNRR
jgi:hypothetical protein